MKRIPLIVGWILAGAAAIAAGAWVYNAYLVNGLVTANQNYVLNLNTTPNANGIRRLSAQAIGSTQTIAAATFQDGRVSTATLTVASNSGLVAAFATNQITVAATSVIVSSVASDTIVVASTNDLTGASVTLNGTVLRNAGWRVNVASNTAADIASQINTYVNQVTATAASSTVSIVARTAGANGNSYTLSTSTPTALVVGNATFYGGQNSAFQNQYITVNGSRYARGNYWNPPNVPETSTGTAVSLASLLNTISGIHASAAGSVVYATATVAGTSANSFTLSASTVALTVANPTFTGGVDNAVITVNGTALTQGTQWSRGASVTLTAASIAGAMNTALSSIITSTNVAGVVTSTSVAVGTLANYTITSSTPAAITASHPTYVGGTNSSYTINSPNIIIAANGFATGLPVLLTGSTPPAPLAAGTTYYTISLDANDIQIATTSARALAGQYVTITSSSTSGPHTTTLTPLAFSGTPGIQWQVSNDCTNYANFTTTVLGVAVSSVTFASPYTAFVTTWDLGPVNFQCIRAQVTGPTQGALNLQINMNGSD